MEFNFRYINNMLKFNKLLIILFLTACASTPKTIEKSKTAIDPTEMDGVLVKLPIVKNDMHSPFFNTQKYALESSDGFHYDFYYGGGGRYLVVLRPPNGVLVDFKNTEVSLIVDNEGMFPETLVLSNDNNNNLFSGIGKSRNDKVKLLLTVFIPSSKYNGEIKNNLEFELEIKDGISHE
jgi:hypothetical protein